MSMKRTLLLSLLLMLVLAAGVQAQTGEWPRTLTDGLGVEVTIDAPPQKIVSLSLSVDETLLPIVGPERFAAVTALSQDPGISNVAVQASQVEHAIVSSEDTEQIIALEPDLVFVASFTAPESIQQLRDAGLTVFATNYPVGLDAVRENTRLIGQAVGEEDAAEALIADMDAQIEAVGAAVGEQAAPKRVLYLTPGNYTSGVNSTISEVIAAGGGVDVSAEMGMDQMSPLSDEFIIEQNPDVILLSGWTPYDPTFLDTFTNNPAFANLDAFQNGTVYVANDAHLTAVSPFIAEGVEDAAAYLYPDQYPTFPVTVTDAAGNEVVVPELPSSVVILGEANGETLNTVLSEMDEAPFDVLVVDLEDSSINADGPTVFFTTVPSDEIQSMSDSPSSWVTIYDGDTPAERAANALIIGEALGARVAALETVAKMTDEVAAQAG
jgi:iron complex transport system substrate-binding protein